MTAERQRLTGDLHAIARWRKWGPYLADRAWGTVREDYSANGDAWSYFPHDLARSKAFRWGEDGIAGFCDRYQILCWSLALWNEHDPILKERYFGLVPARRTTARTSRSATSISTRCRAHAYQRLLYKYPQRAFPYGQLVDENRAPRRARSGVRADRHRHLRRRPLLRRRRSRSPKRTPTSLVFRITAHNRGPERAPLHLIPQLWFRNTWSWGGDGARRRIIAAIGRRRPPARRRHAHARLAGLLHNAPRAARARVPARRRAALHRQRDERPARLRARHAIAQPLREGRVSPPHRQRRARRGESRQRPGRRRAAGCASRSSRAASYSDVDCGSPPRRTGAAACDRGRRI